MTTDARRSLWLSQLLRPHVPHIIAFGVTLTGPVDVARLTDSVRAVVGHAGWDDVHIPAHCSPAERCSRPLRPADTGTAVVDHIDVSAAPDPDLASAARRESFLDAAQGADLSAPLWRSQLHALGPERYRWVIRVHHVLTDGAGAFRVMRHIADVYAGTARATDLPIATDSDLTDADEHYRRSPRAQADAGYWSTNLDQHVPSLFAGGTAEPTATITRLTRTMPDTRIPSSTEVLTAFAAFSSRLLDCADVGLALPVAARTTAVRRRALAPLSNVVPLTLNGVGDLSAPAAHSQVQTAVVGALRHQLFRREAMLRDRDDITDLGAVVNLLPSLAPLHVAGIRWDVEVLRTGPVSDLTMTLHPADRAGRGAVTWQAPAARFATDELLMLARRFDGFLTATLDDLDGGQPVAAESIFLPGEYERFHRRSGPAAPDYSATAALLDTLCVDDPDALAVLDETRSLSRRDLRQWADGVARTLIARHHVRPGDPVAVCIERSAASVVAFWAVIRAGGVWVPVNDPFTPQARTADILARAGVRIGLCAPDVPGPEGVQWIPVDLDAGRNDSPPNQSTQAEGDETCWHAPGLDRGPEDRAYLLFTSGSTGRPKGVDMPHRGIPALVAQIRETYALSDDSRMMHASSATFDTGIVEVLSAAATGAALVVAPSSIAGGDPLAQFIESTGVSHIIVTPSVLDTLPLTTARHLRQIVLGGEAVPRRLVDEWGAHVALRNAYGPTETRCSTNFSEPLRPGKPVTVGPPMVGVTEAVLDRHGRAQPPGAVGTLHSSGPQVAHGYLDDPELTAEVFTPCTFSDEKIMYRTGDLATWTPDGDVRVLGRRDQQVKLRGLRIELGEIDAALLDVPGVRQAATLLRGSRSGHRQLVSYVVAQDAAAAPTYEQLRNHLAQVLPTYMVPATLVFRTELPRTVNGKLDTRALRETPVPNDHARPASGPHEDLLVGIIGDVLGVDDVDPDRSFLEHGGDSLAVMTATHRLAAAGHPEVSANDLLTATALSDVAAAMSAVAPKMPPPSPQQAPPRAGRGRPRALTAAERTVSRDPGDPAAQLLRGAWIAPPGQALSRDDVRAVVETLLQRHDALRSVYPDTAAGPIARVRDDVTAAAVLTEIRVGNRADASSDALAALAAEMSAVLDVRVAPPVSLTVLVTGDDTVAAIVAVAHHVAVDGRSLAILADEIACLASGRPLRAPVEPPAIVPDRQPRPDTVFWTELLDAEPATSWTLHGMDPARLPTAAAIRSAATVPAPTVDKLRRHAAGSATTTFEAFAALAAAAIGAVTGDRQFLSATAASGRTPAVDEVVGNFVVSAIVPRDVRAALAVAATTSRRCIASATAPMEDVLVATGRAVGAGRLFPVPVSINFTPAIPGADAALHTFPPEHTRWLLSVEASERTSGELDITVSGAAGGLSAPIIDDILARIVENLEVR